MSQEDIDRLIKLAELLEKGLISKKEFERQKASLSDMDTLVMPAMEEGQVTPNEATLENSRRLRVPSGRHYGPPKDDAPVEHKAQAREAKERSDKKSTNWVLWMLLVGLLGAGAAAWFTLRGPNYSDAGPGPTQDFVEAMLAKLRFGRIVEEEDLARSLKSACDDGFAVGCELAKLEDPVKREPTMNTLSQYCDKKDPFGCYGLALFYAHGPGDELPDKDDAADAKAGLDMAKKACDLGLSRGCAEYAWFFDEAVGVPEDDEKSRKILKRECNRGHQFSCASLATLHAAGEGGEQDRALAEKMAKDACNKNESFGCVVSNWVLSGGLNATAEQKADANMEEATYFAEKGCELGSVRACSDVGSDAFFSINTDLTSAAKKEAVQKAAKYSEKACSHGYEWGCTVNALARFRHSSFFSDDESTLAYRELDTLCLESNVGVACSTLSSSHTGASAAKYARIACNQEIGRECNKLGLLLADGLQAEPGESPLELYRAACKLGDGYGCVNAGAKLRYARRYGEAHSFYTKACERKNRTGCRELASLTLQGLGVARDPNAAVSLYDKACNLGDGEACNQLGVLYNRGSDVVKNHKKSHDYAYQACNLNNAHGCNNLSIIYKGGLGYRADRKLRRWYKDKACRLGNFDGCPRK